MGHQPKQIYEFGPYRLDAAERLLMRDGAVVPLQPKVFDLLLALVERHGRLLEKDELMKLVWPDAIVEEANLANNISILRKTLGENAQQFIETVPKRGYRFVAMVNGVVDDRSEQTMREQTGPRSAFVDREQAANADEPITALPAIKNNDLIYKGKRYQRSALLAMAMLILLGLVFFYFSLRSPLPPKVTPFAQITNDGLLKFHPLLTFYTNTPLVTDGPRLYFSEETGGRRILAQVSSNGGEAIEFPLASKNANVYDLSPSRFEMLVAGSGDDASGGELERPLWVAPLLGGSPRPLGAISAHAAAWSPDGGEIVYANRNDLCLVKNDGTQPRKLITLTGRPQWPRWSPDGRRLRFSMYDLVNRSSSLWEVARDGANLRRLLPDWNRPAAECCGNWTADGRYFIFQATHNRTTQIWAIREKTSIFQPTSHEPVQLTFGPLNYYGPVPSADGRRIFVVGEQRRGELVRYDTKTQQFVRYLSGMSAEAVSLSNDGQWVAYVTYPEGSLWRSKADGSQRLQLSAPSMVAFLPRWSPDGKKIIFTGKIPGGPSKIYLVSAESGSPQKLMPEEQTESDPNWSPDGTSLVFTVGTRASDNFAIYLLDMNTRQVSALPGAEKLFSPRWSPDGRYIVALPGNMGKLMLYDFTSRQWEVLANKPGGYPAWSRDGKYVYFSASSAIFRVRVGDRKLEQVASLNDLRLVSGVSGNWMGLAPDDSPMVLRDFGIQDIYALEWQTP
jgi:Tol biopolymer transport system component/DNA-binding winged helix-turn-helix (wHTH) protein